MPYNELKDIPPLTQLMILILGIWGAFMNFLSKKDACRNAYRKVVLFVIDIISSTGITVLSFLILSGYGFNELFSVGAAGMFGHMGTRVFSLGVLVVLEKLGATKTFAYFKEQE